jgi:two-component system, chemotaxis family, CheB/CheR fusion protein
MGDAFDDIQSDQESARFSAFPDLIGEAIVGGDRQFREVLEALPAAVYITDPMGRITYYNQAAATLWGHRPELGKSEWCGSWKLFWPDGRPLPHGECPMAMAVKERRPIRGMEAVAERPDGSRVPFIPYPTLLYDASGQFVGAVNMLVDITERKRAEDYAQRLTSIVEFSDDAIVSKDLNGVIVSWNAGAERLFGYAADEVIGKPITILIPPDRLEEEPGILQRIARGDHIDHYETIRRRKDGSLVEISLTVSPIKDASGRIVGASKIARDVSERRQAQEQQEFLVGEMKHRVKNTLATVQAIAMQTLKRTPVDEREAFIVRLHALAKAHDLLSLKSWDRAQLRDVVGTALGAFQEAHRARFLIEGPDDVWLEANRSLLLAMALHELATNAVKYGALSNGSGHVSVTWDLPKSGGSKRLILRWEERGGPTVRPPERKGFGSQLIERAVQAGLGTTRLTFDPQGVTCILDVTL